MKATLRGGVLLSVALVVCGALAGSVQASHGDVAISPDSTAITGFAEHPTVSFGTRVLTCASDTLAGATGLDSDVVDFAIGFQEPCSIQPIGVNATVECADGEFVRFHALDATGRAEIDELLPGFGCQVVVPGVCTLTIGSQDLPIPGGRNGADLIDNAIHIDVDAFATNDNSLCGPTPNTVANWMGVYELDAPIDFDPAE